MQQLTVRLRSTGPVNPILEIIDLVYEGPIFVTTDELLWELSEKGPLLITRTTEQDHKEYEERMKVIRGTMENTLLARNAKKAKK